MASINFTFDDAMQAVRNLLEDDAQRRIDDSELLTYYIPRVLQQLRADRPSLFVGHMTLGAENFKPAQQDPIPFADEGFNDFVEALLSEIQAKEEESVSAGVAGMADAKSQRSRRGRGS